MNQQITAKDVVQTVLGFGITLAIMHYVFPMISGITMSASWWAVAGVAAIQMVIMTVLAVVLALVLFKTGLIDEASAESGKTQAILAVPSAILNAASLLAVSSLVPTWIQVGGWVPALTASVVMLAFGSAWKFIWAQFK